MKHLFALCKKYGELIVIGFLSLTPLWWLRNGSVIMGHDSGYRFPEAGILSQLFFSWNPVNGIGNDWAIFKAFLITQAPEAVFIKIFGFFTGERMTLVVWFFVIGFSWWLAVKLLFSEKKYWMFRLWSALFAMFNFFILQGWFITERAKFSLFAALPLAIVIIIKTFYGSFSLMKGTVLFGLLFFLLNGGGSPPLYGGIFVGVVTTFFFCIITEGVQRHRRLVFRCFTMMVLFIMSFCVFNAYWIVPQYVLAKSTYTAGVASEGGIEGLVAWERVIGKNSSFLNLIRLQGIPDWYSDIHTFSKTYIQNPVFIFFSCIPIFLVLLGLLLRFFFQEKGERKMFLIHLLVLLPIGLFFTSGSHPPTGELYLLLLRKIPGFAIFRSSFYKFAPTVWLPIIVLSGYTLSHILARVRNNSTRTILSAFFLLGILLYHFPYFFSDFFRFNPEFSTRVTIPPYVTEAAKELRTLPSTSRVLLIPPLSYGYYGTRIDTYTWGYFSLDILPRNISRISIMTNDKPGTSWIDTVYKTFEQGNKEEIQRFFSALGITHVLYRSDVKYKKDALDASDISGYSIMAGKLLGEPIWQKGAWKLYAAPVPTLALMSASSIYTCGNADRSMGILIAGNESPIIDGCDETTGIQRIVEPTCLMCKVGEYEQFVNAAQVPVLRNDFISSWLRSRNEEKALRQSEGDVPRMIDARLSIAQNRISTVSKTNDKKRVFGEYVRLMNDAASMTETLDGFTGNKYRVRIIAYLEAQRSYVKSFPDTEQTIDEIHALERAMEKTIWMGDGKSQFRYSVSVPKDMQGTIVGAEDCVFTQLDTSKNPSRINFITSGYHQMEFICDGITDAPAIAIVQDKGNVDASIPPVVAYTRINPTEYHISVKNIQGRTFLRFNEGFHLGWELVKSSQDSNVQIVRHTKVDGFANGWIIDGTGDAEFTLRFTPQNYFYLGAVISIVALLGTTLMFIKKKNT
jgi:hypothetical protein